MRPALDRGRIVSRVAAPVLACCVLAFAVLDASVLVGATALPQARAGEDWSAEFESVCSKTQDAMTLSTEELRSLIARCDKLTGAMGAFDESHRKVYAKRVKLCRDLYQFVLESRDKG